jgi:hypothetical protein
MPLGGLSERAMSVAARASSPARFESAEPARQLQIGAALP